MHAEPLCSQTLSSTALPQPEVADAKAPCPVVGCPHVVEDAIFCRACWRRLPEAVQLLRRSMADALANGPPVRTLYAEAIVRQAQQRLEAELAGPLTLLERMQADQLAKVLHGISSLRLVADVKGWWPKHDCTPWGCPNPETRRLREAFAHYYDREQASRGDTRRVTRTDCGGL